MLAAPLAGAGEGRPEAVVKPKRLEQGDLVGLVAPSGSSWEDEDVRFAADVVESLGYRVRLGRHVFARRGYLAGEDEQRAADFNAMFADDEVDAVFAIQGGYGAQRILPLVDFEAIRAHPKALLGYSDITALLNAVHSRTGLVTFHGPIAKGNFTPYTLAEFRKVLTSPRETVEIGSPPPFERRPGWVERENRRTTIVGGKARGRLVGGNLTLLSTLMGTPFQPDFAGKILFLEDVHEEPYRVDRMLTQLWLAGAFEAAAGVVVGKLTDADPTGGRSLSLEEILVDRLRPLGKPAYRGAMIGHVDDKTVVPLGVEAEMDADAGTLTLLEAAVR